MEEDDGYGVNLFRVKCQKMDAEFLSIVVCNGRGIVQERIDVRLVLPPSPVQRMSAMEFIVEHWKVNLIYQSKLFSQVFLASRIQRFVIPYLRSSWEFS
jgi:hypothetical protein